MEVDLLKRLELVAEILSFRLEQLPDSMAIFSYIRRTLGTTADLGPWLVLQTTHTVSEKHLVTMHTLTMYLARE